MKPMDEEKAKRAFKALSNQIHDTNKLLELLMSIFLLQKAKLQELEVKIERLFDDRLS